jgi:hypothetical protein
MNSKIVGDLASVTEELTAPAIVELTEVEISAVVGGLYSGAELGGPIGM